jgi:3-oxoacyl-[acyl-carrier-protein] synthase-1
MAGIESGEIHYINGHGTATLYNDEMEGCAVASIFGKKGPPLSSMKGYFGHTLGAAGVVEAILSLKAIHEHTAPASLGLERLGVSQQIHAINEHAELPRMTNVLTVKSGFGGINAAVVLSR